MKTRTIKDAKNKEIQSIHVVDKYSTKDMELVPCNERKALYDPTVRPQVTSEMVFVTPEMAQKFLNSNDKNRLPSPSNVNTLKNEILKLQWMVGTDVIGFDVDGQLCNGQHRLIALIESGTTGVWMYIMKGIDERYIQKADTGQKRSAADVLKMYGIPSRLKNIVASSSKTAICILQGKADAKIQSTGYITNSECLEFVKANEKQVLISCEYAKDFTAKFMDKNTIAFLHLLYSQSNRKEIEMFFDEVESGNSKGAKTAATALRKILIDDKNNRDTGDSCLKRKQKLIAYVTFANLYLEGKNDNKVSLNARKKFPALFEETKGNMNLTLFKWELKQFKKVA
jgi:hypothetical protein